MSDEHSIILRITAENRESLDAAMRELMAHDDLGFSIIGDGDATTVNALRHPTRIAIIDALREDGRLSPKEFSSRADSPPLGTVSYHFRMLADIGLIQEVDRQHRRGAVEHFYSLTSQ